MGGACQSLFENIASRNVELRNLSAYEIAAPEGRTIGIDVQREPYSTGKRSIIVALEQGVSGRQQVDLASRGNQRITVREDAEGEGVAAETRARMS